MYELEKLQWSENQESTEQRAEKENTLKNT